MDSETIELIKRLKKKGLEVTINQGNVAINIQDSVMTRSPLDIFSGKQVINKQQSARPSQSQSSKPTKSGIKEYHDLVQLYAGELVQEFTEGTTFSERLNGYYVAGYMRINDLWKFATIVLRNGHISDLEKELSAWNHVKRVAKQRRMLPAVIGGKYGIVSRKYGGKCETSPKKKKGYYCPFSDTHKELIRRPVIKTGRVRREREGFLYINGTPLFGGGYDYETRPVLKSDAKYRNDVFHCCLFFNKKEGKLKSDIYYEDEYSYSRYQRFREKKNYYNESDVLTLRPDAKKLCCLLSNFTKIVEV